VKITWTYPAPSRPRTSVTAMASNTTTTFLASGSGELQWIPGYSWIMANPKQSQPDFGEMQSDPEEGWLLLHGRDQAARLLATGRTDWSWFHRVGGVFTFDQERSGLGKTVSRQVWNIIHGTTEAAREKEELRATDPRTILIELALQSLVRSVSLK